MTAATHNSYEISAYLRVASLAIASYDYLQTLPFELRMWRRAWKGRQFPYTSILVLTLSNFSFFYSGFDREGCRRFYLIPALFKGLSSTPLAYNLSRKSGSIGYALLLFYFVASSLEWLSSVQNRTMVFTDPIGNCGSHSSTSAWGAWVSYVVAIIYNFVTTVVCIFFLLRLKTSTGSMMSRVTRMMLVDGIGYFVALTGINFVNLLFNRLPSLAQEVQQARNANPRNFRASLGYCVTWIMSQRLLIHLYEVSVERRNESIGAAVTITQHVAAARDVSHAIRSQFESKTGRGFDLTVPDFDLESAYYAAPETEKDAEVHVRIERTVRTERMPRVYNLEDYSRNPKSTVTSRSTH
ncbi:hypothetical protein K438DRAFT_1882033 [Mycena galopus ATCC 62051]|nr:hypothetical protein K438DRAFT_1882033 [Mycena galopus ATCC 62051]